METKTLGRTNEKIPEIGLGTWQYHGGPNPLRLGLTLGATLLDTAEAYGTEPIVAQAIADQRDHVFLATKVSGDHLHYDDVLKAADASRRRLHVHTLDLYQIHWPNPHTPIRDTM